MDNQQRLEYLFSQYLEQKENPEELEELMELIEGGEYRGPIELLLDKYRQSLTEKVPLSHEQTGRLFQAISKQTRGASVIKLSQQRKWWRIAAAASIILAVALGGYLLLPGKSLPQNETAQSTAVKDVQAPDLNRAAITLTNGQMVYLDSAGNGQLALQGNIKLVKLENGKIVYQTADGNNITELQYNTLTNPRGSKVIDILLNDGSHVWLNAGSSITYPVAFMGDVRKVNITGEAYFEISHDKSKPFIVSKDEMQVMVLGTKFNVNAYDDETNINVTLLEGSVAVSQQSSTVKLRPGEQATLTSNIKIQTSNPNLEEVMSWKNNLFHFESADLKTILRQLARWYNVETVYDGTISSEKYFMLVSRSSSLASVLKALNESNVGFRIEGNKLYVKAK